MIYSYSIFEEKLAFLAGGIDRILLERLLLASHEAPQRSKDRLEYYLQPRITLSAICHFRGIEGWRSARQKVICFRDQCINCMRDPISIFSQWFTQNPVLFNSTFFPFAGMQIPYKWSDEDTILFLMVEGTYIDPFLRPVQVKNFFESLPFPSF